MTPWLPVVALAACAWIKPSALEDDTGPAADGGATDGGAVDAGSGDAGSGDAGSGDAGSGDAGSGDGGTGDGGTGDGGTGDGGTGDGGSGDGGSGDGGSGDGGTGDGGTSDCPDLLPTGTAPSGEVWSSDISVASLSGIGNDDGLGTSVAFIGDLDGDCGDEILALGDEAAVTSSDSGGLYVFGSVLTGVVSAETAAAFAPAGVQDFGAQVAVADVDGDGADDLVSTVSASGGGSARLVFGPLDAPSDKTVVTLDASTYAGSAVISAVAAADFSGSSAVDIALSVAEYDGRETGEGIVLVYEGPFSAGSTVTPTYTIGAPTPDLSSGVAFGAALATCDVDEDGDQDLLVGATGYGPVGDGGVLVFEGPLDSGAAPDGDEADRSYTADGAEWFDFGGHIGCFETGDGPLLLGADSASSPYYPVAVVETPPAGDWDLDDVASFWVAGRVGSGLGAGMAVGDLDGDGWSDLVLGAPLDEDGEGIVYIFYGPWAAEGLVYADDTDWSGSQAVVLSDYDGDVITWSLGSSLATGDLNADGYDDLLIGAEGGALEGDGGAGRGVVQVVLGGPRA